MKSTRGVRLAVDIGGTFTDVAIEVDGAYVTAKCSTTPGSLIDGVLEAIRLALGRARLRPADVDVVVQHGTTLATNAIIERRGAVVGLVTTEGFRDVLEIAYERRYDQYDLGSHHPEPLVPRWRCYPVKERVGSDGRVLTALDEESVVQALQAMDGDGVQSVAVGLVNSFANPVHEQAVARLIEQHAPALAISLSNEVSPEMREYDRLCTTVANAYVKPLMTELIGEFEAALRAERFDCPLLMMTSAGGMTSVEAALRFPIRLLESGPSGGAVLAARIAVLAAEPAALSFDMGGTTAKVCIIQSGHPYRTRELEVARAARQTRASGLPVRIPAVDIIEIGSGGGSIARVEEFRGLVVGPESAGAEPGPASYGRGGTMPTVTDADCILGYLDPDAFGDGDIKLQRDRAVSAFADQLLEGLGLRVEDCARAVCDVVEESMANAARVHAAERGFELGRSVIIAFGGNGPLHAAAVARKVGVRTVIVPPSPGVGSAIGFLCAPVSHEIVRSRYCLLDSLEVAEVEEMLAAMATEATEIVRTGAPGLPITVVRSAFMRYRGQGHEIEIPLPEGALDEGGLQELRRSYETEYAAQFGRIPPHMAIEITNWAAAASTPDRQLAWATEPGPGVEPGGATVDARSTRPVFLGTGRGIVEVPVVERSSVSEGIELTGPALIVEAQTTTFVPEGASMGVDAVGNLVIKLGESS